MEIPIETDEQLFPYAPALAPTEATIDNEKKKESRSARRRRKAKVVNNNEADETTATPIDVSTGMSAAELEAYRRLGMATESYALPGQNAAVPCLPGRNYSGGGGDRESLKRALREKRENRSRVGRGQMRNARAMYKEHQRQAAAGLVDTFMPEGDGGGGSEQGQGFQFNSGLSPEEMLRNVPDGLIDKSELSHFIQQVRQGKVPVSQLMREYDRANK